MNFLSRLHGPNENWHGQTKWLCHLAQVPLTQIIMRINLVILFMAFGSLQLWASYGNAQITIKVKDAPIEEVFIQIEKQSGYGFFYKNAEVKAAGKITLNLNNASLKEALEKCLENQPLQYELIEKSILIKLKPSPFSIPVPQQKLTGKITDENGQPLAGVTVSVKGGTISTMTNNEGIYSIDVAANNTLVFSYLGYQAQEILVGNSKTIYLSLKNVSGQLDQVQIMGYGTTTQRLATGNISVVKAETIANQPVTNPLQALIGRIAGLQITQNVGIPGGGMSVQIRGRNSIAANNAPLYIIDGVQHTSTTIGQAQNNGMGNPLNLINPNDIESISVLKDADATSIYGSRAANGVILITTKRAIAGKTTVEANLNSGVGSSTRMVAPLSTAQYLQLRRDAFVNSNLTPTTSTAPDLLSWDQDLDNNIQDQLFGRTAKNADAYLSLYGGNAHTSFKLSGTYHKENSVLQKSGDFTRGNMHVAISHFSTDRKFNLSFNGIYGASKNNLQNNINLATTAQLPPNYPLYDGNGNYNWVSGKTNVLAQTTSYIKDNNENINASLALGYKLLPMLQIKANIGYNSVNNDQVQPQPTTFLAPSATPTNYSTFSNQKSNSFLFEPQIVYSAQIGGGKLEVLGGGTFQKTNNNLRATIFTNYANDQLMESMVAGTAYFGTGSNVDYNFMSAFVRANYNLNDSYILNGTFRRDGSSRFGPGKQFGNFGSVGAAWLFAKESIFSRQTWLSHGKLRASYGTTGSDGIGDYGYLSLYSYTNDYGSLKAIRPSQIANDDFQWEVNRKLEIAIDLGFLYDRILFNTAWYRNRSGNQLVTYPLPATTGFTGYTANLTALVQNTGWEFELNTINIRGSFNWSTSINLTIPRNKLLEFPNIAATSYAASLVIGQPLNIIQRYRFLGVDETTGLAKMQDINGDNVFTAQSSYNNRGGDYVIAGTTDPIWYGGINNSISYKGFSLDVFFTYTKQKGNNFLSNNFASFGRLFNFWPTHLAYWKQPGDKASIPKPFAAANPSLTQFSTSDYTFSDASFLRLRNVSFYYQLPQEWTNGIGVQKVKLYAQGQNLWTQTNFLGYDPEQSASSGVGLAPLKQFTFGIHCIF
jgi:TonB-linked SusC/RagA family outer membrane protein